MPEKYQPIHTSWQQNAEAPMLGKKEIEWLVGVSRAFSCSRNWNDF